MRKNYRNHKSVGAGARKVEKLVCFLPTFEPHFPNVYRAGKRHKIFVEIIGKYCKNIECIENVEVTTLESNALPLHFAWKGTLKHYSSVQAYNSVDCQKHLILMSRERNSKTPKVAESKLVLGAEFLSTAFNFDLFLVLTVEVFCVALHQNFRIELFHL